MPRSRLPWTVPARVPRCWRSCGARQAADDLRVLNCPDDVWTICRRWPERLATGVALPTLPGIVGTSLGRLQTPTDGPCDWRGKNLSAVNPFPPPAVDERRPACLHERVWWGAKHDAREKIPPSEFTGAPPERSVGAPSFLAPGRALAPLPDPPRALSRCRVARPGSHRRRPRSDRCAKRDALRTERARRVGRRS